MGVLVAAHDLLAVEPDAGIGFLAATHRQGPDVGGAGGGIEHRGRRGDAVQGEGDIEHRRDEFHPVAQLALDPPEAIGEATQEGDKLDRLAPC